MDIQPAILSASFPAKMAQLNLSSWLLGQILTATVTEKRSTDTLLLQINNQQIETKTQSNVPFKVGEQIKLVVEKKGNPVVLRLVQHDTPKPANEIRQQLIRENLPRQANMDKLTQALSLISNNTKEVLKILPLPIQKQIQKLIEQLPTQSTVKNSQNLKIAIKDSGLFLESKLLSEVIEKAETNNLQQGKAQTNNPSVAKDLKANLLQLADSITKYKQEVKNPAFKPASKSLLSTPLFEAANKPINKLNARIETTSKLFDLNTKLDIEALGKQVESSVARIEVNQSKVAVTQDNQVPIWSIEMPVKDKQNFDLLKLDIKADKNPGGENDLEKIWTVNLKINFENIGSLSARLSMIGKEINATLWSEHKTLNDLINNNLPQLGEQIEKYGLQTGKIQCLAGKPDEEKDDMSHNNLINTSV